MLMVESPLVLSNGTYEVSTLNAGQYQASSLNYENGNFNNLVLEIPHQYGVMQIALNGSVNSLSGQNSVQTDINGNPVQINSGQTYGLWANLVTNGLCNIGNFVGY